MIDLPDNSGVGFYWVYRTSKLGGSCRVYWEDEI
jgi:hypothetical protein